MQDKKQALKENSLGAFCAFVTNGTGTPAVWSVGMRGVLLKLIAEREQSHLRQLEMLLRNRDAHNCDRVQQTAQEMHQCDFPAEQDQPQDVKHSRYAARSTVYWFHFFAEG